jgi:hypothetical protein
MNNHDRLSPTEVCRVETASRAPRSGLVNGSVLIVALLLSLSTAAQTDKPLYQNDFEKAEIGKVPDDFLVLDGAFVVQQDGTNKFLELPGAPLESFGVLFGPTEKEDWSVAGRVYGTTKGRRFPVFALGLNGVGGYRLQVSPAKKVIELCRNDAVKTTVPYVWESGTWTKLLLRLRKTGQSWTIEGKVWTEGKPEPAEWMIHTEDSEEIPAGRAGLFCSPFAGTPIRLDDIVVSKIGK